MALKILHFTVLQVTRSAAGLSRTAYVLVRTRPFNDPERPYYMAMPLLWELEKALKIPQKNLDYSGKVEKVG